MNKCFWSVLAALALVLVLGLGVPAVCQTDPSLALQQAQDMIVAKDYDGAIGVLNSIDSQDSLVIAETQRLLGDCYRIKQDFAKAAQYYQTALDKSSGSVASQSLRAAGAAPDLLPRIHRGLITCHIRLKTWDKVAKEIDATSSESPTFAP